MILPRTILLRVLEAIALSLSLLITTQAQEAQKQESQPKRPLVIRKSGGLLQATAIKLQTPTYPDAAMAQGADGPVTVEVTIDEQGNVSSARALSGHPLLTDAAIEAARAWKWEPTKLSGTPVRVIGELTFNFNLGSRGQSQQQIEAYKKQIKDNPKSSDLHFKLAELYSKLLKYADAKKSYERAAQLSPDFAEAYYGLGFANYKLRDSEKAKENLSEAIRLKPEFVEAHYLLSEVYLDLHNLPQARDALKQALRLKPDFGGAKEYERQYERLGWLCNITGQHGEAIEALKKVILLKPDNDGARLLLGRSYLKLGNKDAAMNEYKKLKELNPGLANLLLEEINK